MGEVCEGEGTLKHALWEREELGFNLFHAPGKNAGAGDHPHGEDMGPSACTCVSSRFITIPARSSKTGHTCLWSLNTILLLKGSRSPRRHKERKAQKGRTTQEMLHIIYSKIHEFIMILTHKSPLEHTEEQNHCSHKCFFKMYLVCTVPWGINDEAKFFRENFHRTNVKMMTKSKRNNQSA